MLKEWKQSCHGMGVTVGDDSLITLNFEHGQVVVALDGCDLEFTMHRLQMTYEKWGLQVNFNKTEHIIISGQFQQELQISEVIQLQQEDVKQIVRGNN
jgi:hypothetical protein